MSLGTMINMRSVFYPHLVNGPFGDPALYIRIAHRGTALLFDCGQLHALATRELLKIQAVFISHAHIDHLIGFDHLLRTFLYQDKTLLVYGPLGLVDQIAARFASYTWNLIDDYPLVLRVCEWGEPGGCREVSFRAGKRFQPEGERRWPQAHGCLLSTPDLSVRAVPLTHGDIVSLAYVLEETLHVAIHKDALEARGYRSGPWLTRFKQLVRDNAADEETIAVPLADGTTQGVALRDLAATIAHCERGMKLAYVTDAGPTEGNAAAIIRLARDAHLLAIEAVFAKVDTERAMQRHHLTAHMAGTLGRAANAARLLVFHHSPRYQDEPDRLAAEAIRAFAHKTC